MDFMPLKGISREFFNKKTNVGIFLFKMPCRLFMLYMSPSKYIKKIC
jgi:hypothetical protein